MAFSITVEPVALVDIQQGIDYYDAKQVGLGRKFEAALNRHFISLERNPFFEVRYEQVRCLPVKNYPYMIHFTVNEATQSVIVRGVFHTSIDPENWTDRS